MGGGRFSPVHQTGYDSWAKEELGEINYDFTHEDERNAGIDQGPT